MCYSIQASPNMYTGITRLQARDFPQTYPTCTFNTGRWILSSLLLLEPLASNQALPLSREIRNGGGEPGRFWTCVGHWWHFMYLVVGFIHVCALSALIVYMYKYALVIPTTNSKLCPSNLRQSWMNTLLLEWLWFLMLTQSPAYCPQALSSLTSWLGDCALKDYTCLLECPQVYIIAKEVSVIWNISQTARNKHELVLDYDCETSSMSNTWPKSSSSPLCLSFI